MARIAAVASAFPAHVFSQAEITDTIAAMVTPDRSKQGVLRRLHASSRVETRHLVMPLEAYREQETFTRSNAMFVTVATDLLERALLDALDTAGLRPADVDYLMFTSVTGISAPSVDALLVARIGMRPDVRRVPIYGLGCVAGAAGIARVNDYLIGHPHEVGVLIAVELCSLTFQHGDDSMGNMVASGLFGDGAAAVVMVGDERARGMSATGPEVIDARSRLYPGTEEVIAFTASEAGFRIVLTAGVSPLVEQNFGEDVTQFLAANGLTVSDIDSWIAHPGGPRVLESFQTALALDGDVFENSWRSLAEYGNLSSVSVLEILAEELERPRSAGEDTLLFALGPGVSAELVLLRWPDERISV
ncbi:MAG TPA: 3-oxoacyl-[acyl-carrier-protein] synthase III C-terminal domain-containing protein [Lacisediminihabitans sp.]|uniref:type III polyketide synthase n=1 Tax=Lacisediminihabitans sp. TaxID=2787631 RepID=UPI002EDB1130